MEILNEDNFVQMINSRKPNKDGKIELTEQEYDRLWNIKLGDPSIETRQTVEESKEWFRKSKEFADAYKCL